MQIRSLLLMLVVLSTGCDAGPPTADWVLQGGVVITANDRAPRAEAIALRGNRIAAVGSKHCFESQAGAAEITMAEEEAVCFLGFYNPAATPCIDAVKITMNTEARNLQPLNFDEVDLEDGDPIIELRQPWILPPEQSGKIEAYYYQLGTDETRPLGIWVKQSRELRSLTDILL